MDLAALEREVTEAPLDTPEAQATFRKKFLRKGGALDELFAQLKQLPPEERKALGQRLNALRKRAEDRLAALQEEAPLSESRAGRELEDASFPLPWQEAGGRHPLSLVEKQVVSLFARLGYQLAEGPEIEDDWHNFGALNFEPDHPARDMQDTFFIDPKQGLLLRTHTSTVQVRVMEKTQPPIRILAPGRVYRHETVSARAHVYFHQIEGLCIDTGISAADLKATLEYFLEGFFGEGVPIRWRASYFPFTEMSAEVDIGCRLCEGAGCPVCKYTGWVEVLGCGMVDPAVLSACHIDPEKYTGFAFGLGVERLAQLLYGIPDLRLFSQNDLRFLQSFRGYGDSF